MAGDLFATLDLNLLKTLSVLAQENNMRRAAERLYVTQPAVSQALKKLRNHFGNELFVRTPTGLQPTSFTNDLMQRLQPILDELSSTLNEGEAFDPGQVKTDVPAGRGQTTGRRTAWPTSPRANSCWASACRWNPCPEKSPR